MTYLVVFKHCDISSQMHQRYEAKNRGKEDGVWIVVNFEINLEFLYFIIPEGQGNLIFPSLNKERTEKFVP